MILLYSNLLNNLEFLRSTSMMGKNTLGLKIVNTLSILDLAQETKGVFIDKQLISKEEQIQIVYSLIKDDKNFNVSTYKEVQDITESLNSLSGLFTSIELSADDEKASDSKGFKLICELYKKYVEVLQDSDKMDLNMYCKYVINKCNKILDCIEVVETENFTSMQELLINNIAKEVKTISLADLLGTKNQASDKKPEFMPCYGESNEIREILSDIIKKGYPLDKCVVYLTDDSNYIKEFINLSKIHDIPMHFSCGLPIRETSPYKLFYFLLTMEDKYLFGVDGYSALFANNAFSKENITKEFIPFFVDVLGHLKININKPENNITKFNGCLNSDYFKNNVIPNYFNDKRDNTLASEMADGALKELENIVNNLSQGLGHIIDIYSFSKGKDNEDAKEFLIKKIENADKYEGNFKKTYLESLVEATLSSGLSESGKLEICKLTSVPDVYRPNMYFAGLSSKYFPGAPKQNFLVDDDTIHTINADAPDSKTTINAKVLAFDALYNVAMNICDKVNLSYSFYSLIDVKECNPSSVVYDKVPCVDNYKQERSNKNVSSSNLSPMQLIAKNILNGKYPTTENEDNIVTSRVYPKIENLKISPTDLETFVKCNKKFFYKKIMGLPDNSDKDIFNLIEANEYGTLVHKSMEILRRNDSIDREAFLDNANSVLNDFFKYSCPLGNTEETRNEYLETVGAAYDYLKKNHISIYCTEQYASHDYSIQLSDEAKEVYGQDTFPLTIGGRLDAIGYKDGSKIIIDYKTGRKIKHKTNDPKTCAQILTYQKLLYDNSAASLSKYVAENCWYIYPRKNVGIEATLCTKTDAGASNNMASLDAYISSLVEAVVLHRYPKADKDNECKYCPYIRICNHGKDKED